MTSILNYLAVISFTSAVVFPPITENTCLLRPQNCNLICANGYQRLGPVGCACACALDPCQTKICANGEHCESIGGVPRCLPNGTPRNDCPRIIGGVCSIRCREDSDCPGNQVCCTNGCGRECMFPVRGVPIIPALSGVNLGAQTYHHLVSAIGPIHARSEPIRPSNATLSPVTFHTDHTVPVKATTIRKEKVGSCPPAGDENACTTYVSCSQDLDCKDIEKCCLNACGSVCVDPTKATNCVHFAVAVKKLPEQKLKDGYVPKCDENGKFAPVQCDTRLCWCVDVNYGMEIAGSSVAISMRRGDMCRDLRHCGVKCSKQCPHGLKMTESGCPDPTCGCRDVCDNVHCTNGADTCQLIEPDCAVPPCLPVPRCLVNPCPIGPPMVLQNGVTALCATSDQCTHEYWCHKIGYGGLGFCCSGPKILNKAECPVVMPLRDARCTSTCSTDHDCPNGKCCFDGCGLTCYPLDTAKLALKSIVPNRKLLYQPSDVARHNKGLLSSLVADCPSSVDKFLIEKMSNCSSECESDDECRGMKRCCRIGCSIQCLYPVRTTPCFHAALTAELYEMRNLRRCDHAGKFEPIQCDYNGCFCVDIESGEELAGTRTLSDTPVCKTTKSCPEVVCRTSCPYDFEKEPNGCPSCRCRNPCLEVKCPQDSFCIMTAVSCFQTESCPPQPRCVPNLCPRGEPYISTVGVVETCSAKDQCPAEHWCHQVGFSSSGLCCPSPATLVHSGICPTATPLLDRTNSCNFECKSDEDCLMNEKCCYDGCGMHCKETSPPSSLGGNEDKKVEVVKPGVCPFFDERQCSVQLRTHHCGSDEDCPGVQKCCSDGCAKKCLYPENNSACMQAKTALQMIGQSSKIQCRPDGSFEEIQCDANYCWCVNQHGVEVEGTRTSDDIVPNCLAPRKCAIPLCHYDISCKFGMKKDSNGCDTCECSSPCDGVVCPDTSVCVPNPVECIERPCPEVPRCVVNPCRNGSPLINPSTAQHIKCSNSSQCFGSKVSAYCTQFKSDGGICCPGQEPVWSPGSCPRGLLSNGDCFRHCVTDEECASGQKCCFNGCGMSCVAALFSAPPLPSIHIGECLPAKSLGAFCVQRPKESECSEDVDCLPLRKCCSDGCVRRCAFPDVTTHCIHARLAALAIRDYDSSAFVPECDSTGEYQQIQTHYGLKWCVDKQGKEIPGTKTTRQPNCRLPRSCPVRICDKRCPFGQRSDNEGCLICDCVMPCELIQCQAGFICRMVQPRCYTKKCAPVPRCVPNSCPSGEPLISEATWILAECDGRNACPTEHFCSKSGYEGRGFCCPGSSPPLPPISCPSLPITAKPVDSSTCVVACRKSTDCAHSVCCFNGCGTSCQFETEKSLTITGSPVSISSLPDGKTQFVFVDNKPRIQPIYKKIATSSTDRHVIEASISSQPQVTVINAVEPEKKQPIVPDLSTSPNVVITGAGIPALSEVFEEKAVPISALQKVGACPSVLLNPGCQEECIADADCPQFLKCCKASCGTKCVVPLITTSCLHRLTAFGKEWPHLPPPVQCLPNGEFREVQCDFKRRRRESFMANKSIVMTVLGMQKFCLPKSLSGSERQCWCVDTLGNEVIGTRSTSNTGSPHCKTPKICSTSCIQSSCTYGVQLDANGCPRDGVCLCKNPCDDFACPHHKTCTLAPVKCLRGPCPPIPKCIAAPCSEEQLAKDLYGNAFACRTEGCPSGECVNAVGEDIGVCCSLPGTSRKPDLSRMRTNCVLYRAGVGELRKRGVVGVYHPTCDPNTGLFSRIQCNNTGTCWCADLESGKELVGTRREKSVGINVCEGPRFCSQQCSSTLCPYGLALDHNGCPFKDCACTSPCDTVICRSGEICILRTPHCSSSHCIPFPTCENSPCSVGDRPAVEPRTKRQFFCRESDEICPTGFYCSGFDPNGQGVCCPGREPLITKGKLGNCPHGDAFASSSDGTPLTCSLRVNSCPATHYCLTKPGEKAGICCVSKRHVCNLSPDRGPCSVSVPRFFYSSMNQSCTKFNYGGCAGNLNNFASNEDCESFCDGVQSDFLSAHYDDAAAANIETYELGFTLTGPLIPHAARKRAQQSLANFLSEKFSLSRTSMGEVFIMDDNTVRFIVKDPHASAYAKEISNAVNTGIEFLLHGNYYRAEPHTWFAHQIAEPASTNTARLVFWVFLVASIILAILVFVSLFGTFAYLCNFIRAKDSTSSTRVSSPSNVACDGIFADRTRQRPHLRQEQRFPSNATTRSARSIPLIPSISIERPRNDTYY